MSLRYRELQVHTCSIPSKTTRITKYRVILKSG